MVDNASFLSPSLCVVRGTMLNQLWVSDNDEALNVHVDTCSTLIR